MGNVFVPIEYKRKRLEHVAYKIPPRLINVSPGTSFPRRPFREYAWDHSCWKHFQRIVIPEDEPLLREEEEDLTLTAEFSESDSSDEEPEEEKEFTRSRFLPNGVVMIHLMEIYNLEIKKNCNFLHDA